MFFQQIEEFFPPSPSMNNSLIRFPFLETPLSLGRLAHLTSPSAHDVIVALETEKPLVTTSGSF